MDLIVVAIFLSHRDLLLPCRFLWFNELGLQIGWIVVLVDSGED